MPFDPKDLAFYSQTLSDLGEGGFKDLPIGTYHVKVSDQSEVGLWNNQPRLRVQLEVVGGPNAGQSHSEFLGWFASETSQSEKPYEIRETNTRNITRSWGRDFLSALDIISVDVEAARGVDDAFKGLTDVRGSDSTAVGDAKAAMEGILEAITGHDLFVKVKARRDGKGVRAILVPYDEGMEATEEYEGKV